MAIETPTSILTLFKYARDNAVELSIKYDYIMGAYKLTMEGRHYRNGCRRRCDHYIPEYEFNRIGGELVAVTLDRMLDAIRSVKED